MNEASYDKTKLTITTHLPFLTLSVLYAQI